MRWGKLLLSGSLAMATCLAAGTARAAATAPEEGAGCHRFAIPAQPLATALIVFGKQAGVQVLTDGGTVAPFRSPGASGCLTPSGALVDLLHGTGLVFTYTGRATIAVMPFRTAATHQAPPSHVVASELAPVEADALVARDDGFLAQLTSIASRNDADLIDVPQSVSVITRDLMDSEQAQTVAEAVRNVAGVQYMDGSAGLPLFQIRGFYTGNGLIDGMPNSIAGSGDFPPLIGLERVEVFKGPQSILGDTSGNTLGGLLNVTVKQPQGKPLHEFRYAIDERGATRLGLDLAGPLGRDPRLSYRLVASGDYADHSPQGYRHRHGAYLAPSLAWRTRRTQLVVGAQRIVNRLPTPDHVVLLGGGLAGASRFSQLPGNRRDYASYRTSRLYYLLDRQLGDAWTWRSRGQYVRQRNVQQGWSFSNPSANGSVLALAEAYRYGDAYYSLQNDLVRVFGTGPALHTLTLGLDYSRSRVGHIDDLWRYYDGGLFGGGIYNFYADTALPPVSQVLVPGDNQPLSGSPWSVDYGVFLQDQLALGEHWEAMLALRRAAYEVSTFDPLGDTRNTHRTKWVPNAGLVYKPTPGVALYGGVASGFQSVSYLGGNGRPLPPLLSRQLEVGAKFNLFDERARLTVSLYRIMLDHSYLLVSLQPPYFASLGPGQTNRGLELEFVGRAAPGLDLSVGYTRAHISNHDDTAAAGLPRQRLNLWASYRFQGSLLRGWGVAGGIRVRSRSLGQSSDFSTYYAVPGQAELDVNLSYRAAHWQMTLGAINLLGRRLYAADFDETFVPLRTGRSFLLSGSYDF